MLALGLFESLVVVYLSGRGESCMNGMSVFDHISISNPWLSFRFLLLLDQYSLHASSVPPSHEIMRTCMRGTDGVSIATNLLWVFVCVHSTTLLSNTQVNLNDREIWTRSFFPFILSLFLCSYFVGLLCALNIRVMVTQWSKRKGKHSSVWPSGCLWHRCFVEGVHQPRHYTNNCRWKIFITPLFSRTNNTKISPTPVFLPEK